ncbi:hypothetical protein ACFL1O_00300 [Patescibacteria group bacterium]
MSKFFLFLLVAAILFGGFYLGYYYISWFQYQPGTIEITNTNECYFSCAEQGFIKFPFCVKKEKCEEIEKTSEGRYERPIITD